MSSDNPQSKIISKVLSPALKLWLKSQVEEIENLELKIIGGDRQIMSGYIPGVKVACDHGIYEGIHLDQVAITGENIRVNLGQILRGKPLTLLEPILVTGNIALTETSINNSLSSPLLVSGLTDFLSMLLQKTDLLKNNQISWEQVCLTEDKFILKVKLVDGKGNVTPLTVRSGLALANFHTLLFNPLLVESPKFEPLILEEFTIDLGSEVELTELKLRENNLDCQGCLKIMP